MKITIENNNTTCSIEFEDFDIHEFGDCLRGLLHSVWSPEQVNQIMPTEEILSDEFEEVREMGYEDGYEAAKKEAESYL